jgi:Protein of unknown function (DUF1566)/Bacterial Ig-like domain (group 2)
MFNYIHQLRGLLLISLLCFITACGSDSGEPSVSVYVTDVQLDATQTSFAVGVSQLVEGVATFSDNETRSASSTSSTWSSDNEKVATVDAFGVVTGVGKGTTTINALYTGAQDAEGEFVTGIIEITITPAEVVEIQLYSEVNTVALGVDVQYQVFATYSDETNDELDSNDITWTSSNPAAAQVDASTGIAETLSAEETTISVDYQGLQSSSLLTVTNATLVSLTISPEIPGETSVPAGYTFNFTAEGTYSDDSTGPMTNDVTWLAINHTALEAIEPKGTFRGVSPDDAGVKASFGEISNQIPVIVTPEVLLNVDIEPNEGTFPIGLRTQLMARGYFSNNINKDITDEENVSWESDNTETATVDSDGMLTAVGLDDVNITLTFTSSDGVVFTDMQQFTISDAELVTATITTVPNDLYLVPGQSHQYIAIGEYTDRSKHILNDQEDIFWSVSDLLDDSDSESVVSIHPQTGLIRNHFYNGLAKTEQVLVNVTVGGFSGEHDPAYANLGAVRVLNSDNLSFTGTFVTSDVIQLGLTITSEEVNIEDGMSGPENQSFIMLTQAEANNVCNELVYNKHIDYRLPTSAELMALWDDKNADPAVDYEFYTKYNWSVGKNYWTSTTDDSGETYKVIDLGKGVEQISTNMEYNYVSCVRSTVSPQYQ